MTKGTSTLGEAQMRLRTVVEPFEYEIEKIKGSRFIAWVGPVAALSEVSESIEARRHGHAKARHHCWAYRGRRAADQGSSDDGEPKGSAGPPMAKVLAGRGLVHTLVIVTRYFGGTKLGVGGLVRAYGEATKAVLERVPTCAFIVRSRVRIDVPFAHSAVVFRHLAALRVEPTSSEACATGLRLTAELPADAVGPLRESWARLPIEIIVQ